jgi:NAD(P)-dependent dehydrogenase (short-subunit alcohol dehydrogenase family)
MFNLSGKIAIITGASKGIGKAIAFALGQNGARVVISSRDQESLDMVAKEFKDVGIDVLPIAAHVGRQNDLVNLVAKSVETFGGIDIIVNNAAVNPHYGPLEDIDDKAYQKIMDVNLKAPLELAKLGLPYMREKGKGSIINISSVEGSAPSPGLGMYSVSKAALNMLTKSMATEWGKYNIRANAICPGLIQTKFSEALWTNDHIMKSFMHKIPLNRIGQPEKIAGLAVFLASDAGGYCTGSMFTADGGYLV